MSLNRVFVIRTVSNLFTMLSTKMSFPTSNSIYRNTPLGVIAPCFFEILPLFAMFTL